MKSLLFSLVLFNCICLTVSSYVENVCRHVCAKTGMCESSRQEISTFTCPVHITRQEGSAHADKNSSTPKIVTEIQCSVEDFDAEKTLTPRCQLNCNPWAVVTNDSVSVHNCSDDSVLYVCMHIAKSGKDKKGRGKGRQMKVPRDYQKLAAGKTTLNVKKYDVKKTWKDALEQCRSDGGTLVKVNTRQEFRSLTRKYAVFRSHWIGLKDLYDNDTFFWTDGTPLTFSKWQIDQPSHTNPDGRKENCVDLSVTLFKGQGWNDRSCDKLYEFICEI